MAKCNTYNIDYHAVGEGQSTIEFQITDALFELCDSPEIKHGEGLAVFSVNKKGDTARVDVNIKATINAPCDRCLDDVNIQVEWTGETLFKVTEHEGEYDGDIIYINPRHQTVELGQYIYESIILALPLERAHADIKNCNPDMLKYITLEVQE